MNNSWPESRLGDLCTKIGSGATPRGGKEAYHKDGYSLIRSQNVYNDGFRTDGLAFIDEAQASLLANVAVAEADVLLNITGDSVARVCMVPKDVLPARVNQHVAIVRADPQQLDSAFLRYVLVSPPMQLQLLQLASAGATRNALTKSMIESLKIRVPPIAVQRAIAHILGTLDDKIELNRQMNRTLDEIARTLFTSWFVSFDPVRAKAEGRQPEGMDAETAALFPDRFVDSEMGPIPEGWEVSTVGDEFDVTMGQSPPGSTYNETGDGLPFYQGRADFGFRFPAIRLYCTDPKRTAEAGDTLLSVRAPVGDLNVALEKCIIGRGVAALRHKNGSATYTFHALSTLSDQFLTFDKEGTVFGSINQRDLKALPILAPSSEFIAAFIEQAKPLDDLLRSSFEESHTLAELRDTLLPELLSGRVQIGEAEIA